MIIRTAIASRIAVNKFFPFCFTVTWQNEPFPNFSWVLKYSLGKATSIKSICTKNEWLL